MIKQHELRRVEDEEMRDRGLEVLEKQKRARGGRDGAPDEDVAVTV